MSSDWDWRWTGGDHDRDEEETIWRPAGKPGARTRSSMLLGRRASRKPGGATTSSRVFPMGTNEPQGSAPVRRRLRLVGDGDAERDQRARDEVLFDPSQPYVDERGLDPVQRQATAGGTDDGVHRAATAGVAGSSEPLPHLDRIQRAFGRHDVTTVEAHVGGPAAAAADAIGATAYATGNRVAFRHPVQRRHAVGARR